MSNHLQENKSSTLSGTSSSSDNPISSASISITSYVSLCTLAMDPITVISGTSDKALAIPRSMRSISLCQAAAEGDERDEVIYRGLYDGVMWFLTSPSTLRIFRNFGDVDSFTK